MTNLNMVGWNVTDARTKQVVEGKFFTEKRATDVANKLIRKGIPAIVERVPA